MGVVIFIFEVLSAIPFVGFITNPILLMTLWLARHDTNVNLFEPGRIGSTVFVFFFELIPFAKIFPTWSLRWYLAQKKAHQH